MMGRERRNYKLSRSMSGIRNHNVLILPLEVH
jgi:hypothetical protein